MASAWYVLHTYSGYENKVKTNLEQRTRAMGMADRVEQIYVPTQEVTEIKGGKKKVTTKTSFPGYVLVKMDLDDELWYIVKSTPGVMGFVGTSTHPTPLEEQEVQNIMFGIEEEAGEKARRAIDFSIGDRVRVTEGPFTGFSGIVDEIDEEKSKLRLMISIFGRSAPVELEFFQVEKVQE